jgi:hypothetical protein
MEFLLKYRGENPKIYDDGGLGYALGLNIIGMNGSQAIGYIFKMGYNAKIEALGFGILASVLKITK